MSGGSYDYAFNRVSDMANALDNVATDPRRAAFQDLLRLVVVAMHDIEWVDSGDYGPGDEHAAIDACLSFGGQPAELVAKAAAHDALCERLTEWLKLGGKP